MNGGNEWRMGAGYGEFAGFGGTGNKRLYFDFCSYRNLGAVQSTYRALLAEDRIETILPWPGVRDASSRDR